MIFSEDKKLTPQRKFGPQVQRNINKKKRMKNKNNETPTLTAEHIGHLEAHIHWIIEYIEL